MPMALSLPNGLPLSSTPSHSTSSLEPPPSTPSSTTDSVRPKSERRVSLGVLESAKFRLSHDFARLVRSPSSVSTKSTHTGRTVSTHGSRALASDYENEPPTGPSHQPVDLDHHHMPPLFADPTPESLPRRSKFYGFFSQPSSLTRSRSKAESRPSDSASNESPDPLNATTITIGSTSGTSDSHIATLPTFNSPTSRPFSPSRPLSDNTTTTAETVTQSNVHSRASRAHRSHRAQSKSQHLINDSGINVNESLIAYDPRMPPPPIPVAAPSAQPTSTKEKRRSKPLFGLAVPPWSRPTSPRNEDIPTLSRPPQSPPSRPSKVSKIESWFKIGSSSAAASSRPLIAAPQPRRPMVLPPIPADGPESSMRPHSTPPRIHASRELESSDSERDGRCSPLMGLFTGGRGRAKQRGRTHDYRDASSGRPVVGAPVTRTRTASREGPNAPKGTGGARFEFEHSGSGDARRSTSRNAHRRVASPHAHGSGHTQSHTHHSRGHARKHSHGQDARSYTRTHTRSRSHAHPARSHTHPQPSLHSGTGSPQPAPKSPAMHSATAPSAASQSTTGTAATNTTTGAAATGGTGSLGRVAHTADWVRGAGVHPPFAFESAASSTSANGERRWGEGSGAGSGSDIRERERDRDRERSRRHVAQAQAPASPVRSVPSGPGRWEQREVELGLGLTWAPTKIRVREWTPGGVNEPRPRGGAGAATAAATVDANGSNNDGNPQARALRREREMEQRVRERDGERRTRERLAEYELGYTRSRSRKDREVTGQFRELLGTDGFETFKKYVRRYDADLIPLEGSSGLLGRVERLLDKAPTRPIGTREKHELLDDLVRIVRENEW